MKRVGEILRAQLLTRIKEELEKNNATFVLSYSAVSSSRMDDLRKTLRDVGAQVYVSKNRIAQLALKENSRQQLAEKVDGQTAFVWSNEDSISVSKALVQFVEKCEGVKIRGGWLDGRILDRDQIKQLSDLPAKEVLQAQLLALIASPISRLAGALNAKSRDLLSILKQFSEKKGGSGNG